jgi:hypothetical protein
MEYNWATPVFIAASDFAGIAGTVVVAVVAVVVTVKVLMRFPASKIDEQRGEERLAEKVKKPKEYGNPKEDDNPIESPQGSTIFIPFIRGTSASMSEQFVDHGGRTGGSAADGIAGDLTAMVGKYEAKGYKFQKVETIHIDVAPGCVGMLMGKGKEYHPYDYLVFKKTSEPVRGQSA